MRQYMVGSEDDDKEDIKGTRDKTMETGPQLEEGRGWGGVPTEHHNTLRHITQCYAGLTSEVAKVHKS